MFEKPAGKMEKDRSRIIVAISSAAVLIVVVGIILMGSRCNSEPAQIDMARQDSPEFDSYKEFAQINNIETTTAVRLKNNIGIIRCRVQNIGDRTIVGLQLRGVAIGLNNEVLKETVITPIPRFKESLGPNQSMKVELNLDPIPERTLVRAMTVELYGLKVK
jgi:hypothetical protein